MESTVYQLKFLNTTVDERRIAWMCRKCSVTKEAEATRLRQNPHRNCQLWTMLPLFSHSRCYKFSSGVCIS